MFSRLFGQFLLQEGVVSASALSSAMGRLGEVRPLIGMLALAQGFMTPAQVVEVSAAQKKSLALRRAPIERGYLTVRSRVHHLRRRASTCCSADTGAGRHPVARGFLRLDSYRRQSGLTDEGFEAVKANDVDAVVRSVLSGRRGPGRALAVEWGVVFMKSLVRFVDPGVAIDPLAEADYKGLRGFVQRISGDQRLTAFMAADDDVLTTSRPARPALTRRPRGSSAPTPPASS